MPTPIDTVRLHETPEGVDLALRVAGPAPRAIAYLLDVVIRFALLIVVLPLAAFSGFGTGLILLALFGLEWLYPVFFEVRSGATPGKRSMGLMVVHDDGTPVRLPASLIRNLLRTVDFLPILYGVGLVSMLVDRDFRRLGDLAAGTLVVYADTPPEKPSIPQVAAQAPPAGLALEAQQAILAFAERGHALSEARRIELAEILAGSVGRRGEAAVAQVNAWAAWLARGAPEGRG
ncbi:RDD family protein [Thiocapsa rosea]|uniref:Putative RDD family membrane protein YckC n=1 Tax=Thiocapsa rosea TaxID=69360 RepID=A0A495V3I1_9GAMM|nr:RDD family protein [Thiocapsa rosea]RKT43864.1 putative RDD family membrane protein YckC [Thiocapsa rosea]